MVKNGKTFVLAAIAVLLLSPLASAQTIDLLTEKSGPAEATAGSNVSYTVTVTNIGDTDAANVSLDDPLPGGMTFVSMTQDSGPTFSCSTPSVGDPGTVSCTIASFTVGSSAQFTFVFQIPPGTPDSTFFTNIATSTVNGSADDNSENDSGVAVTSTPAAPSADLFAQKIGPSTAAADSDVTYTITVGNNGPNDAVNANWTDTLPGTMTFVSLTQNSGPTFSCTTGGTVTCSIASFPAGTSATFSLTGHIPSGSSSGESFTNTVTIQSETFDPDTDDTSATHTLIVQGADLAVTKSGPANATAGDNLSYTITVTNNGPDFTAFTLGDTLPPNTTFVSFQQNTGPATSCTTPNAGATGDVICSGGLGNAAVATYTLVITAGNTTSVTNTVNVAGDAADPDTSNNSSSTTAAITANADLAVVKTGSTSVNAGADATYTITVTNNGPSDAASVSLTDTVPPNTTFVSFAQNSGPSFNCTTPAVGATGTVTCTLASMSASATASFTFVVHVASGAASGGTVTNTANVSSTTGDTNTTNNSSSANTSVTTLADLRMQKTGPSGMSPGLNATYTITAANDGPSDAMTVTIQDILPAEVTFVSLAQNSGPTFNCTTPAAGANGTVTCTLAQFVAGASATFTLTVQVTPSTTFGTQVTNTATITSATSDPDSGDTSSSTTGNVTTLADVTITKTGAPAVHAGETTTYTITVTNNGPTDATSVELSDPLPANTTFVAFDQTSGPTFNCVEPAVGSNGTVTCTIATLANGASAAFTLTVAVNAGATGTFTNTATVSSTNDPTPGNNSGSAAVTIAAGNIPTLSTWGLMILAAALGLIVVLKK